MADPIDEEIKIWCQYLPMLGEVPWHSNRSKNNYHFTPYQMIIKLMEFLYKSEIPVPVSKYLDLSSVSYCLQYYDSENKFYINGSEECLFVLKKLQKQLRNILTVESWPDDVRRILIVLDIAKATAIGLIEDRPHSFDDQKLNQWDFREWLLKHGLHLRNANSPPVNTVYFTTFAYIDGKK